MTNFNIFLFLIILFSILKISKTQEIIPKKLIDGVPQKDAWNNNSFYEYYIDISNYKLNEENIFEIYGININIDSNDLKIYLLLTDANDEELIKNCTIKPDQKRDKYVITSKNIQFDHLMDKTYFFLPFKKTKSSQNYLIILVENLEKKIDTLFYVSERIPIININQKNTNKAEAFTKEIKAKNDTRLYYKVDISKIDLMKNNIYFFFDKENISNYQLEVNYFKNFSSLEFYTYDIWILKNINSTEIYFSVKIKNDFNSEKLVKLWIRIDSNNYYFIYSNKRSEKKLYIENINCNKELFIIENYKIVNKKEKNYVILEKFYGNFTLIYYESINSLDFENFDNNEEAKIISNNISYLEGGLINIFKLKCFTPSAFNFEIFQDLKLPEFLQLGQSIKTFLYPSSSYYDYVCLDNLDGFTKYKINIKTLEWHKIDPVERLYIILHTQGQDRDIDIIDPKEERTEFIYASNNDQYYSQFSFGTYYEMFIEYYFTSNRLINNIIEGRTIIDRFLPNTAIKIRKDIPFDYLIFKAEYSEDIFGKYELKLVNKKDIELETNNLMVDLPNVTMPEVNSFSLKFSNPYNKFDSNTDINDDDNYYYLLLSFTIKSNPIYIDIEYIYNEKIVNLSPRKANIIEPELEYEVSSNNDYKVKNKIVFNINKCNDKDNYMLINYYENRNNIIKETKIINQNQILTFDNIYYKSKFILYKEEPELNDTKNEEIDIYPANYYNKGDILLNYFLIDSSLLKELKFTSDYNIIYKEETWSEITLSWKEYVYLNSNNNIKTNIPTNYSIYILPKNSVITTICQLSLIPANKSIVNRTEIKLDMDEGEYKIVIIANVIDNEIPFEIMYNFIEIKIIKKLSLMLIIFLCLGGVIILLIILFLILRKKLNLFKKINNSFNIDELDDSANDEIKEEEECEPDDESTDRKLSKGLINMLTNNSDII